MNSLLYDPTISVPVLIDDPGHEAASPTQSESMLVSPVRCVYFTFDATEPMPNWRLGLDGGSMPFFMLGLSGIVYGTVEASNSPSGWFLSPSDIERTFTFIEQSRPMIVETGRIYLPLRFIKAMGVRQLDCHDVLRLRSDLFVDAYAFAQGRLADGDFSLRLDSYLNQPQDLPMGVLPLQTSPEETKAFGIWCKEQLALVRQQESDWASDDALNPEENRLKIRF